MGNGKKDFIFYTRPFGRLTPVNVGPECISPNICFKYFDLGSFKNMFIEGWWGLTRFAGLLMHWKWKERSLLYILFPFKRLFKEGRWVANPLERGKTGSRSLSWQIHRRVLQIIRQIILQIVPQIIRQIIWLSNSRYYLTNYPGGCLRQSTSSCGKSTQG